MILIIDTSTKKAIIALAFDKETKIIEWEAGRDLASTILVKIDDLYKMTGRKVEDTKRVIVNAGPGSFTGLRIGISIANTIAYALNIPIIGVSDVLDFDELIKKGKKEAKDNVFNGPVTPTYGAEPNITTPKEKK